MRTITTRSAPGFAFALLFLVLGPASRAGAQTTLTLPAVTWGTVRAGTSADAFQGDLLATRASSNPDYLRRAMLKFDTDTTIPRGTPIASATLTVTIAYANPGTARHIAAYQVVDSYRRSGLQLERPAHLPGTALELARR